MPQCPYCEEELGSICFSELTSGKRWGTIRFPLFDGDEDIDDEDTSDSYDRVIYCPHCDHEFTDSDLSHLNDAFLGTTRPRISPIPPIQTNHFPPISPSNSEIETEEGEEESEIINGANHQRYDSSLGSSKNIFECPNCLHAFIEGPEFETQSEEIICPKCFKNFDNPNIIINTPN